MHRIDPNVSASAAQEDFQDLVATHHLEPGEIYVGTEDEVISTLLGSCIAVCITEYRRKVGGMNHFLLPDSDPGPSDGGALARYGLFAMDGLLQAIVALGGQPEYMRAKVFGGCQMMSSMHIGDRNIRFVRAYLESKKLPVSSVDVGGTQPRRIKYCVGSGRAFVRKLPAPPNASALSPCKAELVRKALRASGRGG